MADSITLPQLARNPFAWIITLLLALLAWIPTFQQAFSMLSVQMYGAMGMPLAPFLLFWMIMMAAMMLPALAPTVSIYYTSVYRQTSNSIPYAARIVTFILGYLCLWFLFGIPVFFLAALSAQLVLHMPIAAVGLGVILFVAAGLYQMTPLKQRFLAHCNPSVNCSSSCHPTTHSSCFISDAKGGLLHGVFCLGCCGNLMLVLLAVGLMNLPWMLLVTVGIFLEKSWPQGPRLSFYLGALLLFYGLLAFIDPALLPGLYTGRF